MANGHERVARSRSVIAYEGWPWLLGAVVVCVVSARLGWYGVASAAAFATLWLVLLFRDPGRVVPPLPAAIYAPVDGRVMDIAEVAGGEAHQVWHRVSIRPNPLGAYTIRAPIEGTVMEIHPEAVAAEEPAGLCVRSEEDDHVMLVFPHRGLWRTPRAFVRYGERLGQGQRFAYLRLAPLAEVYLPGSARLCVGLRDRVRAGDTVLAELVGD